MLHSTGISNYKQQRYDVLLVVAAVSVVVVGSMVSARGARGRRLAGCRFGVAASDREMIE